MSKHVEQLRLFLKIEKPIKFKTLRQRPYNDKGNEIIFCQRPLPEGETSQTQGTTEAKPLQIETVPDEH